MLAATRAQARATWIGAVVAVIAVIFSGLAWAGQLNMNEQQQVLNKYLILREQRVYASRIAVWAVDGRETSSVLLPGLDVSLQNRAPVPIRDVAIHASVISEGRPGPTAGAIEIGEVPPCRMLRFRLSPPRGSRFTGTGERWLGFTGLSVTFAESGRRWRLDGSALTLVTGDTDAAPEPGRLLIPQPSATETIGDCGEGG